MRHDSDFHISSISTAEILFGRLDRLLVQSYKGGARAFRPTESRKARGKRKLDELHGARKAGTASAKFEAVQRHGEALGLDQR